METIIIDYGAGNVFSVATALERFGVRSVLTSDPDVIRRAERVIFPGVGQAGQAMERLVRTGLDEVIPRLTVPVLGICLGMQLMCARSEEGQTEGLGIFPLDVKKFGGGVKVPHMGWNNLTELKGPLFKGLGEEAPRMYFVHSYYVPVSGFSAAVCDYGFAFSAALEKDNFFGCQFHPEKSSAMGQAVLKNFLKL
ncbi:MAG: imidazole glycerol phosphate synthase subunit HisH [Flavobacteriales bacterium]|nr:imidazole glycerol phosphate synthase subunit HisH [Flavobacteriales bacterium]